LALSLHFALLIFYLSQLLRVVLCPLLVHGQEPQPHPPHEARRRQGSIDIPIARERIPDLYL
jgi:hypothetical protein